MQKIKIKRIWSAMLAAVLAAGNISGTSIEAYATGAGKISTEAELTSETGEVFDTDIQLEIQGLQRETEEEQVSGAGADKEVAAEEQAEESAAGEILEKNEVPDVLEKSEEDGEADTAEVPEADEESGAEENGDSDIAEVPEEDEEADAEENGDSDIAEVPEGDEETDAEENGDSDIAEVPEEDEEADAEENEKSDATEIPETDKDSDMEEKTAETEALSVEAGTVYSGSSAGNFANVVVFVDFADTDHQSHDNCLKDVEKTLDLFNGSEKSPCGMREYLSNISYGQLMVENIFPQYNGTEIEPYTMPGNAESYDGDDLNTDSSIVQLVLKELNANNTISTADLDRNGDGNVDNLTIVLGCGSKDVSDRFYGRKSYYFDSGKINGCNVADYVRVPEYSLYGTTESYGLIIHEFLHTLKYPDLYSAASVPVGRWDIMSAVSAGVLYPLAWLRSNYTKWFDIPVVTQSCTDYSLYAASAATWETRNQQAVILKTPYSDTEFFVLEFRKKGTKIDSKEYDYIAHGSGLIVYRVNTSEFASNAEDTPLKVYVFRPGDEYNSYGREAGKGDIFRSFLSEECGRTSYGSADAAATLTDGALTYSDGSNSGIVISNVGSASGDRISFDITYHDVSADGGYWSSVAEQTTSGLFALDSCMDSDGTVYYIQKTMSPDNKIYLYQYADAQWKLLDTLPDSSGFDYHLLRYQDVLYVAYNTGSSVQLLQWKEAEGWKTVYNSGTGANQIAAAVDFQGICLAYTDTNNSRLYTYRYTSSGIVDMGIAAESSEYLMDPVIASENGKTVVMYREWKADNRWSMKQYDSGWKSMGEIPGQASMAFIRLHKGMIYLLTGCEADTDNSYLYLRSLTSAGNGWTRVTEQPFASGNIVDLELCFHGDAPHVICQDSKTEQVYVYSLVNGTWEPLGDRVVKGAVLGLKGHSWNGQIYLTYRNDSDGKVYIKSHVSQNTDGVPGSGDSSGSGGDGNTGDGSESGDSSGDSSGSGGDGNTGDDSSGTLKPGWNLVKGKWYYYSDGRLKTGWLKLDNTWYYMDGEGIMQTGWLKLGNKWYYLSGSGAMKTGWLKLGNTWYYLSGSGAMKTGWLKLGNTWYYLSGSGAMKTGWLKLGNTWYYLSGSGAMKTGWLKLGNTWYYLSGSGAMKTGWLKLGNTWYYLSGSGAMVNKDTRINGVLHRFEHNGGWLGIDS